jgi:pimeloyl-ACP methyl ester carboxylesterase
MTEWQQGDVFTNGIRMHYYRTGGDKPAVVLAHGFSDSGLCWTPVAEALSADYDVIMIDARGHGLSEAPASSYCVKAMGADLAGLIEALGLEMPAVIGHSMGGLATMMAVADHPELIRRAILEDAGIHDFPIAQSAGDHFAWIEELKRQGRDAVIALGRQQSPNWSEAELEPWADAKLRLSPNALSFVPADREPWRDIARRIQRPMLVIRADNDKGASVTPAEAAEASRINPLIETVYVPGAGHNVRRENYTAFMAAIRAFLAQ